MTQLVEGIVAGVIVNALVFAGAAVFLARRSMR